MLIAITNTGHPAQVQFAINGGGPSGTDTGYQLNFQATWADSGSQTQGGVTVPLFIPQGTKRTHFNQMIIDAIVAAVDAGSGLSLDPSNLFFTPFENG